MKAALLGLELLSYGHVLIGNMCSYYTNAIFDAMNGRRNTIVPYISLDGCAMHAHPSVPFNVITVEEQSRIIGLIMYKHQMTSAHCVMGRINFQIWLDL